MRTLHVITHRAWVASDFADVAPADVTVAHSLGLDAPRVGAGDALWAPTEWAARARRVTHPALLPLADAGADFLPRFPEAFLGRVVTLCALRNLAALGPMFGFFKLANAKADRVPAGFAAADVFYREARSAGVPDDSLILWTETMLPIVEEHRVFFLGAEPVTSSPYLMRGKLWSPEMTSAATQAARQFASDAISAHPGPLAAASVIDVALLSGGRWVVLEANPVWSSAVYGADPVAVIECLFAANAPGAGPAWVPDPHLVSRAARQRNLPTAAA